jgi:ribonuclease R
MENNMTTQKKNPASEIYSGVVNYNIRGFGFVTCKDLPDLYVSQKNMAGILSGDLVNYEIKGTEAIKVSLVERGLKTVVCDVHEGGSLIVDKAVGSMVLPSTPASKNLPKGSAALVQLEPFRILRTYKDPLDAQAITERVMARYRLPLELPKEAQTERLKNRRIERRNLTSLYTITIDDDSSEDLDDALSCEIAENGDVRLYVHIADVSNHVTPGSAIDKAAAFIPTSVYLPAYTRHMLPRDLASNYLSLIPKKDRNTLTVEMLVTPAGFVKSHEVYASLVQSNERVSYKEAARIISGDTSGSNPDKNAVLHLLHAAASRLGVQRRARGGVEAWRFDESETSEATRAEEPAHMLVERLMVATNEVVAQWLHSRNMPAIYRTHSSFQEEDFEALNEVIAPLRVTETLSPQAFAALASQYSERGDERRFWEAVLKIMPRAIYTYEPGLHFGLGSPMYVHFTSPLRRYADLLTHRSVHAYLAGAKKVELGDLGEQCSNINVVGRRADLAQRDSERAEAMKGIQLKSQHELQVGSMINTPRKDSRSYRVRVVGTSVAGVLVVDRRHKLSQRMQGAVTHVDPLTGVLEFVPADYINKAHKKTQHPDAAASPKEHPQKSSRPRKRTRRASGPSKDTNV